MARTSVNQHKAISIWHFCHVASGILPSPIVPLFILSLHNLTLSYCQCHRCMKDFERPVWQTLSSVLAFVLKSNNNMPVRYKAPNRPQCDDTAVQDPLCCWSCKTDWRRGGRKAIASAWPQSKKHDATSFTQAAGKAWQRVEKTAWS